SYAVAALILKTAGAWPASVVAPSASIAAGWTSAGAAAASAGWAGHLDSPFLAVSSARWQQRRMGRAKRRQGPSIGRRQLGFQCFVKGAALEGRLPAVGLQAEVGAASRFLAGRVHADGSVRRPHDSDHLALGALRPAGHTRPLRDVP